MRDVSTDSIRDGVLYVIQSQVSQRIVNDLVHTWIYSWYLTSCMASYEVYKRPE